MSKNSESQQEFSKRYFTIGEAEVLLQKISRILRKVVSLNKALDILSTIEIEVYDDDYENLRKLTKINRQFHKLSYQFFSGIESIEGMGCIIIDYEIGIINFYSRFESRDIFLSWRLGEKGIKFWHEVDECYMQRKPILELNGRKQK